MADILDNRYTTSEFLLKKTTFHVERADFKAKLIAGILKKNGVQPSRICDLGCDAGESARFATLFLLRQICTANSWSYESGKTRRHRLLILDP